MVDPPPAAPRAIGDEETLTQYGFLDPAGGVFPSHPRWGRETDLSMLLGAFSVDEAAKYVRISTGRPSEGDAVRLTTAGALRQQGFSVRHSWRKRNPYHVSVEVQASQNWDDESLERAFPEARPND